MDTETSGSSLEHSGNGPRFGDKDNVSSLDELETLLGEIRDRASVAVLYELVRELGSFVLDNARGISILTSTADPGSTEARGHPETSPAAPPDPEGREEIRMTIREKDILRELLDGKSNREISRSLGIAEKTVKNHLWKMYRKWGVKSRIQLCTKCVSR